MKKTILVPSEFGQQIKPLDETLNNLDSEMIRILQTPNMPPDIKLIMYNQTLGRYAALQSQKNKPYQIDVLTENSSIISDEEILKGIPETKTHMGKLLLEFIRKQENIEIEKNGGITINGTRVENSNIIDLIHDLVRDRKTRPAPRGVDELLRTLKNANLPIEYIGNKNRLHLFNVRSPVARIPEHQWVE